MSNNFSRNSQKISDIFNKFNDETLIIDNTYQRRKVWGLKDNVRLIETIILGLVIPEIFLWDCETDPSTGKTLTHIVDGQQRINAIIEFISNKYKLQENFLIDREIKKFYANKSFSDLSDIIKTKVWTYHLSIVQLNSEFTKNQVRDMFYRLNLTDYSLNDQEKRNSLDSAFGKVSEKLANHEIWADYRIFSPNDIRRMADVEYCSNIILLCREGIIDQTRPDKLNQIYSDFVDKYDDAEKDMHKIQQAISVINQLKSDEMITFAKKKVQLYTLFSIAFDFIDNKTEITESVKLLFNQFVRSYNAFKNEYEFNFTEPKQNRANEMIKKYKLASSEGVNKLNNRMIRFEVLKKILTEVEGIKIDHLKYIEEKFNAESEKEKFDN